MWNYDAAAGVDMKMFRRALVAVLLLVVACADDGTGTVRPAPQRYHVSTTVLESPEHGPQLCLGGVATSLPPQCSGPDIVGWDWDAVADEESVAGTSWGRYRVVGTFDGVAFTLTETPGPPDIGQVTGPAFATTPCRAPAEGWAVVAASATPEAQEAAIAYASGQPEFAGLWLDQSINPASSSTDSSVLEAEMNDPTKLILNVSFTESLALHESELRALWGGALCVSQAQRTAAELQEIEAELRSLPGLLWSGDDQIGNRIEIGVIVDDGSLQAKLDERYDEDVVKVESALQPLE